jgi:hypothetical protein
MKKLVYLIILLFSISAFAKDIEFSGSMTNSDFKDFTKELGTAIQFNPMGPAEPLGITGFDISLELSAVDIGNDKDYWKNMSDDNDPASYLIFTRLHAQKGLPYNIDIGAMYEAAADSNIQAFGLELKWAILDGSAATPAVAVRTSYSQLTGVDDLSLNTIGADVLISKGILMFTPYAGLSVASVNSSEDSDKVDLDNVHTAIYNGLIGVQASLTILSFKAEVSIGEIPKYNFSVGLKF